MATPTQQTHSLYYNFTLIREDRLDKVVFDTYGDLSKVEEVMALNPNLLNNSILAQGTTLKMPYVSPVTTPTTTTEIKAMNLW